MDKYVTRPHPIAAEEIVRLGASPGYVQLKNGSVINFKGEGDPEVGSFIVYEGGEPKHLLSGEVFNSTAMRLPDSPDLLQIEKMIGETDFVETGDLTLCVLTLEDGRKVSGVDNAMSGSQEERREIAYHDAFNNLLRHETYVLQGLHALFKEQE